MRLNLRFHIYIDKRLNNVNMFLESILLSSQVTQLKKLSFPEKGKIIF